MPISIYSNISSLTSQLYLDHSQAAQSKNMAHLASGLRIASASDDAAGLGISTNFDAQVRSYAQGGRNANDGVSLLQTAEGALSQVTSILERMRELAVESANGTYGTTDRSNIVVEVQQLQSEIDRIANSTRFGNIQMLNASTTMTLQVGSNNTASDQVALTMGASDSITLKVDTNSVKVDTQNNAMAAINNIDTALNSVSSQRANIGAMQNRLSVAINNDQNFGTNLAAATSRIRDVDVAAESADLARNNVLLQAGMSVLAQANQAPQAALKLLQ